MYIILHLARDKYVDEAVILVQYISETGFLQKEVALIDSPFVIEGCSFSFSKYIISLKRYFFYNKFPFLILRK